LRAVGLDAGPMTRFDPAKVEQQFFPEGKVKANVLINIGYGDDAKLFPRTRACRLSRWRQSSERLPATRSSFAETHVSPILDIASCATRSPTSTGRNRSSPTWPAHGRANYASAVLARRGIGAPRARPRARQENLVEVVHTLKQVVCMKG